MRTNGIHASAIILSGYGKMSLRTFKGKPIS